MRNAYLRNVVLSALLISGFNVQTAQGAIKLGAYYGKWASTATYAAGDVVVFNNNTYLSLIAGNKSKNPAKAINAWQVLGGGAVGPQGVAGPQGIQGAVGPTGATAPQGATGPRGPAGLPQAGNVAGEMQYWDGSQWQLVAPPSPLPVAPAMATLHFCNGVPTWAANCVPVNTHVYAIGTTGPAGGKVFYLNDITGLHGLEVAPADQSSGAAWGCYVNNYYITVPGAQGTAVGTGAANTAAIVAACSEANTAAKIADAYALNGYTDWFLPSKDELNLLYRKSLGVGGFANEYYWSSSEYVIDDYRAWVYGFPGSSKAATSKDTILPVRVIRAF